MTCSGAGYGGPGHGGAMAGGAELSAVMANRIWGQLEQRDKGEKEEELTGSWPVQTTGPGKRRSERDGEADLRWPRRGKMSGRRSGAPLVA